MRQLLLVNPNTTQTMTESMVAAARKVLPSDTDIISFTSDYGPPSIEGYYDEAFVSPSKSYLFKVLRREKIKQGREKETLLRYSCNHEDKNADIERHYKSVVNILQHETNLLLDWMVTYDNRRIIRLPGSVHGKSMRVCREINFSDDNVIKNRAGRPVGYIPDEPIP